MMLLDNINYDYSNSTCYIYNIIFNNNKGYIGSTLNPRRRLLEHLNSLEKKRHSNIILQKAFEKHGIKEIKIIYKSSPKYRDSLEKWFITKSYFNAEYNISLNVSTRKDFLTNKKAQFKELDICNIFNSALLGLSLKELSLLYKTSVGTISDILNGKTYRYESANYIQHYLENKQELIKKILRKTRQKRVMPVYQYDLEGNFIKMWKSASEVEKNLNIGANRVSMSIRLQIRCGEYRFSKNKTCYDIPDKKFSKKDVDDIFSLRYSGNTITTIAKHFNCGKSSITSVLNGETYKIFSKDQVFTYKQNKNKILVQKHGKFSIFIFKVTGEFVKEVSGIKSASEFLQINKNSVQSAFRKQTSYKGYVFSKVCEMPSINFYEHKKEVFLYDRNKTFIKKYSSLEIYKKEFNISNTLFYNYVNKDIFCEKLNAYLLTKPIKKTCLADITT